MTPLLATLIYICTCNAGTQHEYSVSIPDYGCAPERDAPRLLKDAVTEMYQKDAASDKRRCQTAECKNRVEAVAKSETRKELRRCRCAWVQK